MHLYNKNEFKHFNFPLDVSTMLFNTYLGTTLAQALTRKRTLRYALLQINGVVTVLGTRQRIQKLNRWKQYRYQVFFIIWLFDVETAVIKAEEITIYISNIATDRNSFNYKHISVTSQECGSLLVNEWIFTVMKRISRSFDLGKYLKPHLS